MKTFSKIEHFGVRVFIPELWFETRLSVHFGVSVELESMYDCQVCTLN